MTPNALTMVVGVIMCLLDNSIAFVTMGFMEKNANPLEERP